MTIIKGIEFNLDKSSNSEYDWSLVFNSGTFQFPGAQRQTQEIIFNLNKADYQHCKGLGACYYNIYYNPKNNQYKITEANYEIQACGVDGYLIGGFQVRDCKLYFASAKTCEDVEYQRNFTPEYSKAFVLTEFTCDDGKCLGEFNNEAFTNAFETECIIGEGNGGAFVRYGFDTGFTI